MDDEAAALLEHAATYLDNAEWTHRRGARWYPVAFDEARHAAELAGKALLVMKTGAYPRHHSIGGVLHFEGLVPASVGTRELNRLLDHHTAASYGYHRKFSDGMVVEAIRIARELWLSARAHMARDTPA